MTVSGSQPNAGVLRAVIAAGGTAGHIAPALVIADELQARGIPSTFLVSPRPLDTELVSKSGYSSQVIHVDGLPRSVSVRAVQSLFKACIAVPRSIGKLRQLRPDVVVCGGGFVCAPVAVAAWLCRIPVVATEADRHLGLANRIASLFARRLCVAYPLPQRARRQVVTGRPVRAEFCSTSKQQARAALKIPPEATVISCVGGSGGATHLSDTVVEAFGSGNASSSNGDSLSHVKVIHVTGKRDFRSILEKLETLTNDPMSDRYEVVEYSDQIHNLFAASDIVISRPGGTVFELAAVGRASILVPSPNVTGDHQTANARYFSEHKAAVMIVEAELTPQRLRDEVAALLDGEAGGTQRRDDLARAMQQLSRPDAGRAIATIAEQLAQAHAGDRTQATYRAANPPQGPLAGQRMHLLGIGGAGVSGLARLVRAWGANVDGCDKSSSAFSDRLASDGISVSIGHSPDHIKPGMRVVVSSALAEDHPEIARARSLGCEVIRRGELLGSLTHLPGVTTIVVAGAHGKSTTTSMFGKVLLDAGLDPSVLVGADVPQLGGNARVGTQGSDGQRLLVLEGDESDRTLQTYRADIAIITNIELDHHASYSSTDELIRFFCEWVESLGQNSTLVLGPDANLDAVAESHAGVTLRFGQDPDQLAMLSGQLQLPGLHNALNASAVLVASAALQPALSESQVLESLGQFAGLGRRYELVGATNDIEIRDDYAHHPTEVAATIRAAKAILEERGRGRVVVVFQPHLYSRTRELADRFGQALALADIVRILPIYGAREEPIPSVSSALVADAARAHGITDIALSEDGPATGAASTITNMLKAGDIVITMGAGDVTVLAPRLLKALQQ